MLYPCILIQMKLIWLRPQALIGVEDNYREDYEQGKMKLKIHALKVQFKQPYAAENVV